MLLYFDDWTILLAWAIATFSTSFLGTLLAVWLWTWAEKQKRAERARRIALLDDHNLATEEHTNAQLDIPDRPTGVDGSLS